MDSESITVTSRAYKTEEATEDRRTAIDATSILQQEIGYLAGAIEALEKRLTSILQPTPKTENSVGIGRLASGNESDLQIRINDAASDIVNLRSRIETLSSYTDL